MAKAVGRCIWVPKDKKECALGNVWLAQVYSGKKVYIPPSVSLRRNSGKILVTGGLVSW